MTCTVCNKPTCVIQSFLWTAVLCKSHVASACAQRNDRDAMTDVTTAQSQEAGHSSRDAVWQAQVLKGCIRATMPKAHHLKREWVYWADARGRAVSPALQLEVVDHAVSCAPQLLQLRLLLLCSFQGLAKLPNSLPCHVHSGLQGSCANMRSLSHMLC